MTEKDYAALIKRARKARQWSQAELARRMHTSVGTVSRWENGHTRPNLDQMGSLSPLLGIPLDMLIESGGARLHSLPEAKLDPGLVAFLATIPLEEQVKLREFLEKAARGGPQ